MTTADDTPAPKVASARAFVVTMGIVALFGDMTYEGGRGLVGPYLALLGADAVMVGFAAGLGEFLGYALRLVSGWLGDRTRAWWRFVIAGYAINLVAVPGLAFVGHWQAAVALLLLERIGKAIRSPSRSTLVSHAASVAGFGRSFGIEEALDQIGAMAGPLLTALAMWLAREQSTLDEHRVGFAVLLLPALATVGLVLRARRRWPTPESFEPDSTDAHAPLAGLFRWYVAAAALVGLGFADWALVAFHALREGLVDPIALPLVYAGTMGVDAIVAYSFGDWFDRAGLRVLAVAVLVSACFAPVAFLAPSGALLLCAAALWAVGMGAQESIFKAAIAKMVPKHARGRAYGIFFAVFGLAWWIGSTLMGYWYANDRPMLVVFSVVTQLAAVPILWGLARKLPA